ncbi:thioredoxin [Neorickettsia helminthoeca str. Oregon]|uniref:Thioredoxin n=1 Tax=Neorickettsia helminthoeca str. Oregon TaxID=1286528 RepID=X5HKZ3_9RICK|nr:thioredoxin [Neorickettsia helminthoeca]AHX11769.1 thioredoxin [Neorickettsia helminthoeca str. Oregon]
MKELEDFSKQVSDAHGLVLLDFWAEWCGPCKQMIPVLQAFSEVSPHVSVYKVNIDGPKQALAIENGVRAVPTLILFKDGKMLDRKVGMLSLSQIKEWVASLSS